MYFGRIPDVNVVFITKSGTEKAARVFRESTTEKCHVHKQKLNMSFKK